MPAEAFDGIQFECILAITLGLIYVFLGSNVVNNDHRIAIDTRGLNNFHFQSIFLPSGLSLLFFGREISTQTDEQWKMSLSKLIHNVCMISHIWTVGEGRWSSAKAQATCLGYCHWMEISHRHLWQEESPTHYSQIAWSLDATMYLVWWKVILRNQRQIVPRVAYKITTDTDQKQAHIRKYKVMVKSCETSIIFNISKE